MFDRARVKSTHIRRLWLENCRLSEPLEAELSGHRHGLAVSLDFSGLTSLRLRRLHIPTIADFEDGLTSGDHVFRRIQQNTDSARFERELGRAHLSWPNDNKLEEMQRMCLTNYYELSNMLDDAAWEDISKYIDLPVEIREATIVSHERRSIWAYNAEG